MCLCWLLTEVRGIVGTLNGKVGLDGEETGEGAAFLVRELAAETVGVEDGLALRVWHLAKVAEGSGDQTATIFRETAKLLHGSADLLALRRGEVRHGLVAVDNAAALFGRHAVELGKAIEHALLCLRRKVAKAGFALQGALLVCEWQATVTIHPLGEVFLILLLRAGSGVRRRLCRGMLMG